MTAFITLGFAENGHFTNRKGMEKLIQSFYKTICQVMLAKMATSQLKIP